MWWLSPPVMDTELRRILLAHSGGYSAAAAVVVHRGETVASAVTGQTAFSHGFPVTPATLFDLASLTKMFVTVAALRVGPSTVDLDEPVARWLPSLKAGEQITPRQLLTHTSGLPPVIDLVSLPDKESRLAALFDTPLSTAPFDYSCVGFIVLGLLLERATGTGLASLVHEEVIAPLGLCSTGYLPDEAHAFAATEYQPTLGRGLVSGIVHDETAWSLGGVAGNAGIFGTVSELARFGEALRARELLPENVMAEMTRDQLPAHVDPGFRHGLGVRLNAPFMGPLKGFGHTGFTGTSLVVSEEHELTIALLTNRVHPHRDLSDVSQLRIDVAEWASRCV